MEKRAIVNIFLIGFLVFLTVACSPRIIEHVRTEVVYRDRMQKDSVFFHDSVFVSEKIKGDTVYIDRFKYRYIYKDKYQTDTLIREVHDTTSVEVKVEKSLSWVQKTKINAFWWLITALVAALLWIFRKPILRLIGL